MKLRKTARLRALWDGLLLVLTLASLAIIAYVEFERLEWSDPAFRILAAVDLGIVCLLALDLVVSLVRSKNRRAWLRQRWFELPGLVPLYAESISFLRFSQLLRLSRVIRLLRATNALRRSRRTVTFLDELLNKNFFGHALLMAALVILGMASIVWMIERDTNPQLSTFADSLWWAIVTATTVGYGDITPQTGLARMIATVLMIMGIGLIGVVASTISSALLTSRRKPKRDKDKPRSLADELERLAALRRAGLLTEDEFTRAKGRVLGDVNVH